MSLGASAFLDFTCLVNQSRIDLRAAQTKGYFFGGYKSGGDTEAQVTFGRVSDTGTGTGLPQDSNEADHSSTTARLLYMPVSAGKHRIGAFYCNARKGDVSEKITAIIVASNSKKIYDYLYSF